MKLFPQDWSAVFLPDTPLIELIVRGVILYFIIIFILRILPRRTTGELGAMDLVFILLITEAASHSLGDFTTIGEGAIMIGVFMICNYGLNQLTYRSKFFQKVFGHQPLQIVSDGRLIHKNMRKELVTKEELLTSMRENGIEEISEIKQAFVEGEGNISFIKFKQEDDDNPKVDRRKG